MAPDAEDCEVARLNLGEVTHQGRRILPDTLQPATAWSENENERLVDDNTNSSAENRRLLPSAPHPPKHKSRLEACLILGVQPSSKYSKCPQMSPQKIKQKSKFEKRKDKLIPLLKPPYFILSVILIIGCIHMWISEDVRKALEWSPEVRWREPWRLLTYGFVHATVQHLALNELVALVVGWQLEREQSWWRIVCLWCGGLVAGALGADVLQPNVRVVGASAAVYALLTAHITNVCLRFGHIPLWWFRPLSVVVLGTSEMCWALLGDPPPGVGHGAVQAHSPYEHVAWGSHILGAAIGIPLAFLVFTGEHHNKTYVVVCRVISAALLIASIIVVAVYYTIFINGEAFIEIKST